MDDGICLNDGISLAFCHARGAETQKPILIVEPLESST